MADVKAQFGREAEKYLTSRTHANSDELARLIALVQPRGGIVLDVATGAGHVAYAFAPYVERIIASDITSEMLAIVEREAQVRGYSNLEVAHADAEDLPFELESIDGVTCRVAAHHFPNPRKFIAECYRVLKPMGWFLLIDTLGIDGDKAADDLLNRFETIRDPSHVRNYTVRRWVEWLTGAGFRVDHVGERAFYHELGSWMDRMSVPERDRETLRNIVANSEGALREYFRPTGTEFQLHQVTVLSRKIST